MLHLVEQITAVAALSLLAIAGRAAFVYFSPYRECRWCRPGGLLGGSLLAKMAGHKPKRRRRRGRRCWRCKGHRLTRRLGAKQVHKTKLSLRQAWREWRYGE